MRERELMYMITLMETKGLGPAMARRLQNRVPAFEDAQRMAPRDWEACGVPAQTAVLLSASFAARTGERAAERLLLLPLAWMTERDEAYPPLLREIADPPLLLFYLGPPPNDEPCVAVVGTRRASAYGRRVAKDLAAILAKAGAAVVSGMAIGVDTAAHEGAILEGRTIAVLGSGVCVPYPNGPTARRILESGGTVVSEFLPWTGPEKHRFPVRNRIISGLSRSVIVVEAGSRSGSLITANLALEQNRDVFVVPGNVYSPQSCGTNELLLQGAAPLTDVERAFEMLDLRRFLPAGRRGTPAPSPGVPANSRNEAPTRGGEGGRLSALARMILQDLQAGACSAADLLDMPVPGASMTEILGALTELEMSGRAKRDENGRYAAC